MPAGEDADAGKHAGGFSNHRHPAIPVHARVDLADGDTEAMTIRLAVILAGGEGTRLRPYTSSRGTGSPTSPLFPGIGEEQIELVAPSLQEALDRD